VQLGAWPPHFVQTPHPANEDVRTEAADIASEGSNGSVRRDQQREYVEAVDAINLLEPRLVAAGGQPLFCRFGSSHRSVWVFCLALRHMKRDHSRSCGFIAPQRIKQVSRVIGEPAEGRVSRVEAVFAGELLEDLRGLEQAERR
jgi:hypothetical protein